MLQFIEPDTETSFCFLISEIEITHLRLLALRGMMRFLSPMRGLSCSAKRQTTTWLLRTILDICWRVKRQWSIDRAGHQWNVPETFEVNNDRRGYKVDKPVLSNS